MDKIIIEGGRPLSGSVRISGAKNAALPLMAAAILAPLTLDNMPNLRDLSTMDRLLTHMGGRVGRGNGRLELDLSGLNRPEAPYQMVKTMRASALVLGPLLARHGRARVSLPGGCAIGLRPIDRHLKALEAMGAAIDLSGGYVEAKAPTGGLRGTAIHFDDVTVTGTENLMLAAVLAKGRTTITGAAREPEVTDTARALLAMGARISGLDTDQLVIDGVEELRPAAHQVMSDRIEAGTLIVAGAMTGGRITLENPPHAALAAVYDKLRETGINLTPNGDELIVEAGAGVKSTDITTRPYPGFPTDMQAQFMALMTIGDGVSLINETIFENRFMHVSELGRLGAEITLEGRTAVVRGIPHLSGAPMMATDLRASASLILAALAARGRSEISRVYHLDRGYDRLDEKLAVLGADISRVPE
ncbi:MAG: UDP-N-acetylglucosamine 1-carboxyvinyltransferase [Candidatus Adiutrix sp.]|jgi:UDP-N-acetylglucosamine 1-carboxyvinyltransferase|nr:UDP-N-acetylglucosamine 1-carboxyvinyltransferase [Candidatus Adiutrix sp.]